MTPGAGDQAVNAADLATCLGRLALSHPQSCALRFGTDSRSYAELDRRASDVGTLLDERGVRPGDRVAVLSTNRLEVVDTFFGIVRLGAIVVPLNTRLSTTEVRYQLNDCGAEVLVAERALLERHPELRRPFRVVLVDDLPPHAGTAPCPSPVVDDHSPAFILYTSGTTGPPKGAMLSHRNLVFRTYAGLLGMGVAGGDEVWYSGLPLFHIGGWSSVLMYLYVGATVVLAPSTGFDADAAVAAMVDHGATGAFFVPTQWQAVCDAVGERRIPLRRMVWGASPAPRVLLERMSETFPGVPNISAFGQTETAASTCMLRGDDSIRKMGSVGTPLVGVAVRIVDDEMRDVPRGEVGEIVYQGPTVFLGYWNRPEATAEATAGGWFHSGDLCRQDDDGFIWVVDRKKDMIVTGGENVYCAEVESVLSTHPGVRDVAVIGLPHPRWVETPCAVIVPTDPDTPPDPSDVIAFAAAHLASYKKPTSVEFVDILPRNASGKVLKTELRSRFRPPAPHTGERRDAS
ncbi:AMP-binding protein [Pseudonocardia xishanensis]|uniref:Fatty-acid--CoA ligase FadD5 n=1 Tax=Pseudonocardia xishanensis TaxID=630995 RepID=A0ABP8RUC8_9PSEU